MRPQFSAARSPALIASIVAVALLLSQAAPGLATNFGAGGGVMFANGAAHSFIYVGLTTNYQIASDTARTDDLNPTDINTSMNASHDAADVAVYDEDRGDVGYYGIYTCIAAANATTCNHAHAVFNLWAGLGLTAAKRISNTCHEFGHSVGLRHDNTRPTCLDDDALFPTNYTDHDRIHINGKY